VAVDGVLGLSIDLPGDLVIEIVSARVGIHQHGGLAALQRWSN
jgi:hypothetical protein